MKPLTQFNLERLLEETSFTNHISEQTTQEPSQWLDIDTNDSNNLNKTELSRGTFIDHENLSLLISDQKIIRTWPTQNWSLLMIDQTERFAIFEANDSYHMSILDLESSDWKEDKNGNMLYFSDDGETVIDNFHSIIHAFPEE